MPYSLHWCRLAIWGVSLIQPTGFRGALSPWAFAINATPPRLMRCLHSVEARRLRLGADMNSKRVNASYEYTNTRYIHRYRLCADEIHASLFARKSKRYSNDMPRKKKSRESSPSNRPARPCTSGTVCLGSAKAH